MYILVFSIRKIIAKQKRSAFVVTIVLNQIIRMKLRVNHFAVILRSNNPSGCYFFSLLSSIRMYQKYGILIYRGDLHAKTMVFDFDRSDSYFRLQ